jgi:hypothetical protein
VKSLHVSLVPGDPSVDCSLGDVAHWHCHRSLQEKATIAFFNENHGIAQLVETQLAT